MRTLDNLETIFFRTMYFYFTKEIISFLYRIILIYIIFGIPMALFVFITNNKIGFGKR